MPISTAFGTSGVHVEIEITYHKTFTTGTSPSYFVARRSHFMIIAVCLLT